MLDLELIGDAELVPLSAALAEEIADVDSMPGERSESIGFNSFL
ncbi:hypothetical protein [Cryptosporangium phraense]|nr:hypothetical protein [Cryptosporangium phraense]